MRVKPPSELRGPGEAPLDQHDLQFGERFENAFEDHTGRLVLHGVHQDVVVLDIELWPAAGGWSAALGAPDMQADGQVVRLGSGEDRPVPATPYRLRCFGTELDLGKSPVAGPLFDFLDGGFRIIRGDQDRGA